MKDFILDLDKPRRLVFDFDAWDVIADKYAPREPEKDFDISNLNITYREVPFLIYAGLCWEDPELTEEKTKSLLNEQVKAGKYTIMAILNLVVEAMFAQAGLEKVLVKTDGAEKKAPGPAAAIPGSRKKGR